MPAPQRQPDAYGDQMRNSALGAAIFGVVLVFGVVKLHDYAAWREVPGENPEMAWVAMVFPALAFLLAFVNWRAYRKHVEYERRKHRLQ